MFGLWGKVLRVDLSRGRITEEDIPDDWARKFIGGRGLGTRYLIQDIPKGADPLGPENELAIMTGPLTGTPSPSASRYSAVAKSPLTNTWGEANAGGYWAPSFKANGFDGILFQGISPKPVYLAIDEGEYELRDASHLWGKNVWEMTRLIKDELGEEFEVMGIGVAGEKMVRYACLINNDHRAAGRCGMGAVMGSKRVKAVANRGTKETRIANRETFIEVANKNYELIADSMIKVGLETYGTHMIMDMVNVRGFFPTRNSQAGYFEETEKISAETLVEQGYLTARKACYACPIECGRISEVKKGKYAGLKGEGPEYETVSTFGGMCCITDLDAIIVAHNLCDDYGLDTISTGNTIAFAMECYEKGILTKADTGGLELEFGNGDAALELVHRIAKREGIGDVLAEGVRGAAQRLGKGSERFAMHVKGLEMPGYEPRVAKLVGLSYATASRGCCHVMSMTQLPVALDFPLLIVDIDTRIEDPYKEKAEDALIVKALEDATTFFDCTGACKFMASTLSYEEWVKLIANVTGRPFTFEDYKKCGERGYNLERVFHIREGITRADDTLPWRCLNEPMPSGPAKGQVNTLEILLDAYYQYRGWDKNGKPTPEKLKELELEEFIDLVR